MDDAATFSDLDLQPLEPTAPDLPHRPASTPRTNDGHHDGSLPPGYSLDADGIVFTAPPPKGGARSNDGIWLCSAFTIEASFRAADRSNWGRLFKIQTADGSRRDVMIFEREIEGSLAKVRAKLVNNGLCIAHDKAARIHFDKLLRSWRPTKIMTLTESPGWVSPGHKSFVLGNGTCLGAPDVLCQVDHLPGTARAATARGTAEQWRSEIAAKCAGNPVGVLAISLAFVGPLLSLCNWHGGGIHLRGPSSCGKSTMMTAANSVWGPPERMQNWRTTDNALEDIARSANDSLLCLDELGQVDAHSLDNAAYMLAEGRGKQRARQSGETAPERRWRIACLSTGEISLSEKLAEIGRKTMQGQEVRLVDVSASAYEHGVFENLHGETSGAALSNAMKGACADAYGIAGQVFVQKVLKDPENVRGVAAAMAAAIHRKLLKRFECVQDVTEHRVMMRMSKIAAAGILATRFGLTGWARYEALTAIRRVLEIRYESRGADRLSDMPAIVGELRAALAQAGRSMRLIGADPSDVEFKPVAIFKDARNLYVPRSIRQDLLPGRDAKTVARILDHHGLLEKGEGSNLMKRVPRAINWIDRAYTVPLAILRTGGGSSTTI